MSRLDAAVVSHSFDDEYEALPESIKMIVSKTEYAWMGPERRATLVWDECMPDGPEE